MAADPIDVLHEILRRNGEEVNLRESEVDRYFLFDRIADPAGLDLAWAQFPAHEQIRSRADQIDAVSDIVPGFGYRTPKNSNRCSDAELVDLVRRHLAAIHPLVLREDYNAPVLSFLERPYGVCVVDDREAAPDGDTKNELFLTVNEAIQEFDHYSFESEVKEVLNDWATMLTNCSEVKFYLLWPAFDDIADIDPNTPLTGFELWRYGCRTSYWIKDNDPQSGIVCVNPPWQVKRGTGD